MRVCVCVCVSVRVSVRVPVPVCVCLSVCAFCTLLFERVGECLLPLWLCSCTVYKIILK